MNNLLPSGPLLGTFLVASLALAVTPGPGVFYIVTRSLSQGRRSGLASVAGVALGNLSNAVGASIGLAAIFAISSIAFTGVKYAGALYLIYLGARTLRSPRHSSEFSSARSIGSRRIFRDGFIVALLNPKTTVFFAAFLPQFIGGSAAPMLRSAALGTLFVLIAATTDSVYALFAGAVAPALAQARGVRVLGRYLTGGAFIGLGVLTALAGTRNGR